MKDCNITKTKGGRWGCHQHPPLYHGGGMSLLVRPRVKHLSVCENKLIIVSKTCKIADNAVTVHEVNIR